MIQHRCTSRPTTQDHYFMRVLVLSVTMPFFEGGCLGVSVISGNLTYSCWETELPVPAMKPGSRNCFLTRQVSYLITIGSLLRGVVSLFVQTGSPSRHTLSPRESRKIHRGHFQWKIDLPASLSVRQLNDRSFETFHAFLGTGMPLEKNRKRSLNACTKRSSAVSGYRISSIIILNPLGVIRRAVY